VVAKQIKTEAEALRLALLSGLASSKDVIAWADRKIAIEAAPHITIIDLALAVDEDVDRLALRLTEIPGEASLADAIQLLLKALMERLDHGVDPRRVAEHLYRLTGITDWPEEQFGSEPYWLDDLFQPESAYGGMYYQEALAALRTYLAKHTASVGGQTILTAAG
jgi:hypothetical protein